MFYRKLLLLPQFLLEELGASREDLLNGLKLSGFFIDKYLVKSPKIEAKTDIFSSRSQLINLVAKSHF